MTASNLSTTQRRALDKFVTLGYFSAYDLQESRLTLNALVRKGLLERFHQDGHLFLPRIRILYRLPSERVRVLNG